MFGYHDLKKQINISHDSVECPVIGCDRRFDRQRNTFKRDERFLCSEHKIYISPSTFEYDIEIDNLLWKNETDLSLLNAVKKVKRKNQFARDNSEDAVTWNVFRYLEVTNQVAGLLGMVTQTEQHQAELIYWAYSQKDQGAWAELNNARKEFGENLQQGSEPDLVAMTENGLFFIETKLTAKNNSPSSDINKRKKYLIGGNKWFSKVFISNYETIIIKAKLYELLRFWLLGSWLATQLGRDFYLINITLSEREMDIEQRFRPHIQIGTHRQFKRVTWEEISVFIVDNGPENRDKSLILDYFNLSSG